MAVDPRHISLFLEVVRAGSFSGAAERRNLTQPAVSVAIAQLEHALGARLLERRRSGVILTPAGALVLRRAEAIETHLDAAKAEVSAGQMGITGPLVIGGTPGALVSLVPNAVTQIARDYPHLALHIREGADAELMALLRAGKVDLVIVTTRIDAMPDDVVEIDVCADSFIIVSRPGEKPWGRSVSLGDLAGEKWVLPAVGGAFRRQVDAMFLAASVPLPHGAIRCDSLATTKEIVRTSSYISLLPQRVVAAEMRHGLLDGAELREQPVLRWIGVRVLAQARDAPLTVAFTKALAGPLEPIR